MRVVWGHNGEKVSVIVTIPVRGLALVAFSFAACEDWAFIFGMLKTKLSSSSERSLFLQETGACRIA